MGNHDQERAHQHQHQHHHHQQHRPQRLWVPPRSAALAVPPSPSKSRRLASVAKGESESGSSVLVVLFLSLRSLYSLLPFLRSSPSFSLFPFSFLLSLLSFALTLFFYLLSPPRPKHYLSLSSSHRLTLAAKSALLALVFLLRFQALRYCGTASMILAELTGSILAQPRTPGPRALLFLSLGLLILSFGWDRVQCFPFSPHCLRFFPLLLPFLAGFLSRYQLSIGSSTLKHLGHKRLRLLTLLFATLFLFPPALLTFSLSDSQHAFPTLAWPLANTVVFGVLLNQSYSSHDHDHDHFKHSQREFLFTFGSTLVLELFYFPELSLWGLLLSGLLLYLGVRDLDPFRSPQEGLLSDVVLKPIRHVLSERKSRKIALFLLINAAYMVVEFTAGFMSNSLGLISDACHMLFDCAALAIGLYASYISRLPANNHYNYGRGRFEVLSGYANAVFLVLVGALIVVESFERILDPQEISTSSLLVVSVGGLLVNVVGLIFFHEEHHHAHGHGWSGGSCSHPHPHSELHNHHTQHLHDHNTHAHQHGSNQEFISIPSDCPDDSCHSDHGHHHHHHDHSGHESKHHGDCLDNHSLQNLKHHDARCHDHDLGHHHHHHDHSDHESKHHDEDNHDVHSFKHHDTAHCHEASHVHQEHGHHGHRHIDHNMEGIFLHVLADTMGSVGVVISTLLIKYKGWLVADPACSIFISILIVSSVIPLLKNSAEVLLQRVPRMNEHNLKDALSRVLKIRGVYGIQKFHSWSFTNTDVVGTMHLHVSIDTDKISAKSQVLHLLHDAGIKDVTLQVECVG